MVLKLMTNPCANKVRSHASSHLGIVRWLVVIVLAAALWFVFDVIERHVGLGVALVCSGLTSVALWCLFFSSLSQGRE